jgi:hypothetical protein
MPNPFTQETLNSFERFQRNRTRRQEREESARILAERGLSTLTYRNLSDGSWIQSVQTISSPVSSHYICNWDLAGNNNPTTKYSIGDYVFVNPEIKFGDRIGPFQITRDMMKCSGKICKISYVDAWDGSYRLDILRDNLKSTGTRIGWFTDKMLVPLKTNKK